MMNLLIITLGALLVLTDISYHLFGFPKLGREVYITINRKIHIHHGYIGLILMLVGLLI